jgi:hypothetical protein
LYACENSLTTNNISGINDHACLKDLFPGGLITVSANQPRIEAGIAASVLTEYPKFCTIATFRAFGLPIADALIIYQINSDTEMEIYKFCQERQLHKVLLRSEVRGGLLGSPSCQGVVISQVYENLIELLHYKTGTIVAIQAAGNIFRNLYNINLYYSSLPSHFCTVEVTGIGFTASDLNRNGIIHERIVIPKYINEINEELIRREYKISDQQYKNQYYEKINRYGKETLTKENATIISQIKYNEIPLPYIKDVWDDQSKIWELLDYLGFSNNGALISMSFIVTENNIVKRWYWDIHANTSNVRFFEP